MNSEPVHEGLRCWHLKALVQQSMWRAKEMESIGQYATSEPNVLELSAGYN